MISCQLSEMNRVSRTGLKILKEFVIFRLYSDVWSFGLTICELAIGKFPLPVNADKDVVQNVFGRNFDIMHFIPGEDLSNDFLDMLKNW